MDQYTFEQLPTAISLLQEKMDNIERMLREKEPLREIPEDFLNVGQAAKLLDVAVPTIYAKVWRKEIPFSKRGKRLYFSRCELIEWIRSGKKKTLGELKLEAQSIIDKMNRRR